jgi:hypothetical protein
MRTDRTRQRMRALVRQWERGNEPRKEFAERHGLTISCLDYWKRQVRRTMAAVDAPVTFAPVRVLTNESAGNGGAIDIVLPTGERLAVHNGTSGDLLRSVLAALRASC